MKSRMMKKVFAGAMSAVLVMGMSLTTAAADTATGTAPIYSFDVESVIVPTTLVVAFNPDGLTVKTGTTTSTDQVLSQSFGILNKSSKDKIVTVTLNVEDLNTDKIEFANTAAEVTNAGKEDYVVYLVATPAGDSDIKVGTTPAAITKAATATDLASVTMTKASGNDVVLGTGDNKIAFKLDKATYKPVDGDEVTLGGTTENDVSSNYELDDIAANGKGATAFTFTGSVNDKADWTKITQGIKITATYTFANAESTDTIVSGTGAMVTVAPENVAPTFTTGDDVGAINYTVGKGTDGLKEIKSITMMYNTDPFDGYNAGANWTSASDEDGVITFQAGYISAYAGINSEETQEATVTYETNGGVEKTVKVDVKLR